MLSATGHLPQDCHRYCLEVAVAYKKQRMRLDASVACKSNGQLPGSPLLCTCSLSQPQNPAMFTIRQLVVSIGQAKGSQARA